MYRTSQDPHLLVPGEGIADIRLGDCTPDELLTRMGNDCRVSRHDDGNVFQVSYDYEGGIANEHQPGRPAQRGRPANLEFRNGLLCAISAGVYQTDLHTEGDLRVGASRADVLAVFGPACDVLAERNWLGQEKGLVTLRYLKRGIEWLLGEDATVIRITLFQTRRSH